MRSVELKNIKTHNDMSEETVCYSATVYIDGKKAGTTRNAGHGGNDEVWLDKHDRKDLTAFAEDQCMRLHLTDSPFTDLTRSLAVDIYFGHLVELHEEEKWLKRNSRNKIMFQLKGDGKDEWRNVKVLRNSEHRKAGVAWLRKRYGSKLTTIYGEK